MSRIFASPQKARPALAGPGRSARATSPVASQAAVREIVTRPRPQARLRVGDPGDRYEREADRVADRVMRMPEPAGRDAGAADHQIRGATGEGSRLQRQASEEEEEIQPKLVEGSRIQRLCTACQEERVQRQPVEEPVEEEEEETLQRQPIEEEEELLQAKPLAGERAGADVSTNLGSLSSGRPLGAGERRFFEPRLGADLERVRVHTGPPAERLASDLNARAFIRGRDIVFGRGQYRPGTTAGRRLMAHELVHTMQQGAVRARGDAPGPSRAAAPTGAVQRAIRHTVTKWEARKLGPPTLTNSPRTINIPPTGQIRANADVQVNGDAGDSCNGEQVGTTQTAWIASCVMQYRGQRRRDGSVTLRHRASMPMRDPAPAGSIWYDNTAVRSATACGDTVSVTHFDSPWHSPPKARNNGAVAGNPLVYLTRYRRGLNLVTYLTTRSAAGTFRRRPLKFLYWATVQDFSFTPQYASPPAHTAFLGPWPSTGQVKVYKGSMGSGLTSDAPYYRTAGTEFNTHFNTFANWRLTERTG